MQLHIYCPASSGCEARPSRKSARALRLRLPSGLTDGRCAIAAETLGPAPPLGECRRLALGGDEDPLQHLPLHRLLDDRHIAEPAIDAFDSIAGDEDERNLARRQYVGDGIDEFASEVDVDDAGVNVLVHR